MTDGEKIDLLRTAQPVARNLNGGRQIRDFVGIICLVDQGLFIRALGLQARSGADAIDLALHQTVKLTTRALDRENLEFQARRSGVDDQNCVHGDHTAATAALRRRASA